MAESEIVEVYSAASAAEAHFVRNLLDEAGIEARVVEDLSGGLAGAGQPMAPRIWVRQADEPRAREIVAAYEAGQRRRRRADEKNAPWVCSHCGAAVEGHFEICWNCQRPRPAG